MSAYGHEMEREYSAQSLSTRGSSEMGSHYSTEAGIYMSASAATVFISGLVTVGISVVALLIALTVMLNSCQSRNSGVLEMYRNTHSYDYCRNFALHAELNSLGADLFPEICKDINIQYIKEGQYKRDLNITLGIAEGFFSSLRPQNDDRDVVLMDADDLLGSETLVVNDTTYRIEKDAFHESIRDANYLKHIFATKLCLKLQSSRWPLILFSRRPEKLRNTTVEHLMSIGCHGWSSLIMRIDDEMLMDFQEFLSRRRTMLQREGFRIMAVISSQMDALSGRYSGNRVFKLPNPFFRYNMENHGEIDPIQTSELLPKVV
ncbi:UNVERIFIED_CONTAM: hypothetical protein Sangu_2125600 [Sesamum angustifolium]|uniref:Acid phosphatase n=1 Tax=Sesamum angustifolium TaxID=2727405 RepID=A0AAW2LEH5_9LAMI